MKSINSANEIGQVDRRQKVKKKEEGKRKK